MVTRPREKLLYSVFTAKTEDYMRRLRGKTVLELAEMLAKFRDHEGYMSEFRVVNRQCHRGVSLANFGFA